MTAPSPITAYQLISTRKSRKLYQMPGDDGPGQPGAQAFDG